MASNPENASRNEGPTRSKWRIASFALLLICATLVLYVLFQGEAWFAAQPLQIVLMVVAAASMVVLVKGADWLVENASGLALSLGISKVIVGATVVSLGTTSPEAAVSVTAAWSGEPGLALGNAVGSIIADTALIFGLGCAIAVLPADRFVLSRQGWLQFASGLLLAGICYGLWMWQGDDASIGGWIGMLLLLLLVGYMYVSVKWTQQHAAPDVAPVAASDADASPTDPAATAAADGSDGAHAAAVPAEVDEIPTPSHSIPIMCVLGVLGLALVIVGSRVLVGSVSELAYRWSVPDVVIAATLVAVGTSLPELVVGMMSIAKGHKEILVGNVIGADILNVLFVVGAAAVGAAAAGQSLPIVETVGDGVSRVFLQLHLPVMLGVLILFRVWIAIAVRKGTFSKWMGWPLVIIYFGYVIGSYLFGIEVKH